MISFHGVLFCAYLHPLKQITKAKLLIQTFNTTAHKRSMKGSVFSKYSDLQTSGGQSDPSIDTKKYQYLMNCVMRLILYFTTIVSVSLFYALLRFCQRSNRQVTRLAASVSARNKHTSSPFLSIDIVQSRDSASQSKQGSKRRAQVCQVPSTEIHSRQQWASGTGRDFITEICRNNKLYK